MKFRLLFGSTEAEFRLMGLEPDRFVLDRPPGSRRHVPSLPINSVYPPPVFLLRRFGHRGPGIPSLALPRLRTYSLLPFGSSPSLFVRTRPGNTWSLAPRGALLPPARSDGFTLLLPLSSSGVGGFTHAQGRAWRALLFLPSVTPPRRSPSHPPPFKAPLRFCSSSTPKINF